MDIPIVAEQGSVEQYHFKAIHRILRTKINIMGLYHAMQKNPSFENDPIASAFTLSLLEKVKIMDHQVEGDCELLSKSCCPLCYYGEECCECKPFLLD